MDQQRAWYRLSAAFVANATAPGRRFHDGGGLYLVVRKNNTRDWLLKYQRNGVPRGMGLGSVRTTSLSLAREKANAARRLLAAGVDPIEHRKTERHREAAATAQLKTVREVAGLYLAKNAAKWSNEKHKREWKSSLDRFVHPVIGSVAIGDVEVGHVLKVVEPIWHVIPETARRVLGRIEELIDFARVAGLRRDEGNPAKWRGGLDAVLPAPTRLHPTQHHAAMHYRDVPGFMTKLRAEPGVYARALELLILTAVRMNELLGARWDEVDGDKWTIPASRVKSRRPHIVPLCQRARDILRELSGADPVLVFPGRLTAKTISDNSLHRVLHRLAGPEHTAHGFRSAFRDFAAERTGFAPEIAEAALAHTVKSAVERAYKRTTFFDQRRKLMAVWEAHCAGQSPASSKVVALRA